MRAGLTAAVAATAAAALATLAAFVTSGGAATARATGVAPSNTAAPTISGTAATGQTLTASSGTWTGDAPITYAYQWETCDSGGASCSNIAGQTAQTYSVVAGDVGKTLRVQVTGTNGSGSANVLSAQTAVVVAGTAPASTAAPVLSGTTTVGQTLTVTTGTWSGSPTSYAYAWQSCDSTGSNCNWISGATSQTYLLSSGDASHRLRALVTATNSYGSGQAYSNLTSTVGGSAVANTAVPVVSGTLASGQTLTVSTGSWSGSPTSYTYAWQRCDSTGNNCTWVAGATGQTYGLGAADVNQRLRALVTATASAGSGQAYSGLTGTIGAGSAVTNTALPVVTGTLVSGQTLSVSTGSWSVSPTSYGYAWQRCDSAGSNCAWIPGASGRTYVLAAADVNHRLRAFVSASTGSGTGSIYSGLTGTIAAGVGTSTVAGAVSVSAVSLPNRLVISRAAFLPSRLKSRNTFVAQFRVTDSSGHPVVGALVYAIALPYGWISSAPEVQSGADGWASIQMRPTANLPLKRGAVVMFVRARKPGDSLLAGVSTRRLVQVGVG